MGHLRQLDVEALRRRSHLRQRRERVGCQPIHKLEQWLLPACVDERVDSIILKLQTTMGPWA